jgi:outer membrane protein assembly factor BamD (BamD/ComL family)
MKKILFVFTICLFCSFSVFCQSKKTWEKTVTLNTISGYENFIKEYPDGKYTELAKKFIEDLKANEAKKIEMDATRAKALAI